MKGLLSICQQIWKILYQQWSQDWKRSVFIPIPKKGNAEECSNHHTIALISHASKVMFKVLQARLQQYVNRELPEVQAGFRKGRGTRDQTANIHWIIKKEEKFQKSIYFCFIDYAKAFVWITTSCGKFLKTWKYNTILPASWEIFMQVKKQHLEPDMEESTGSKLGKEYIKAVYCHPAYLIYRVHHTKCWAGSGWSTSWNQDCWDKYQQLQICRWYHPYSRKWRRAKAPPDEGERGELKSWIKTEHSKNKDHGI